MSGLLNAIPGLARHQSTASAPVKDFDLERACRLVDDATALLTNDYPAGALEWLRQNRPDVARYLKECERDLDAVLMAEDMAQLPKVLDRYVDAHRRAFKVFEARPPVIEVDRQGGLFQ